MGALALQTVLHFKTTDCITCGAIIALPEAFYDQRLRDHHDYYCPSGHSQHFTAKSDKEKLAEEQARHQETLSRLNREMQARDRLSRKLKRVKNGVCPECNRTFSDLAAHMKCKHSK